MYSEGLNKESEETEPDSIWSKLKRERLCRIDQEEEMHDAGRPPKLKIKDEEKRKKKESSKRKTYKNQEEMCDSCISHPPAASFWAAFDSCTKQMAVFIWPVLLSRWVRR